MAKNNHNFGNLITANVQNADTAEALIEKALGYIKKKYGYTRIDQNSLFSGVYYDSKKVGSFITRVIRENNETAVLKLQLQPLPFDEGFIIRSIEQNLRSETVRPVKIFYDKKWSEGLKFGYLIFEDLSHLPNLWKNVPTEKNDRELHKNFLEALQTSVLPIENPWIPKPQMSIKEKRNEVFEHFHQISKESNYQHIEKTTLQSFIEKYLSFLNLTEIKTEVKFTHGHLSGFDVKYNEPKKQFILMANLYWSWRPEYYELVFPIWVDLMHIRDEKLSFDNFLSKAMAWIELWPRKITESKNFWFLLLERSILTIMLDLGASEWKNNETEEKRALLIAWQEFFSWIIENKINRPDSLV